MFHPFQAGREGHCSFGGVVSQCLEKIASNFPNIGKKCAVFSRHWKIPVLAAALGTAPLRGADATTLYVWTNSPAPASPFTNWYTAARDIQAAVTAAAPGDLVLVTNGTYDTGTGIYPPGVTNRIALRTAITVQSVNGPDGTWILGGGTARTVRCVYLTNGATLVGFTLAEGSARMASGGGARTNSGGGAYCDGDALISSCVVIRCRAYQGGGIYARFGGRIESCRVESNTVRTVGGGVLFSSGGMLSNCVVAANAAADGGGVYLGGSAGAVDCAIEYNAATNENGGGIYLSGADNFVDRCRLASNRAALWGGGLYFYSGSGSGTNTLHNSAFHGNSAYEGGGLFVLSTRHEMDAANCTIAGNRATRSGGVYWSNLGRLRNCIVQFNSADAYENCRLMGTNIPMSFCCAKPRPAGEGNTEADPQLRDGPAGNLRLRPGSPCLNTGTNLDWTAGATDLEGRPRILDEVADMGAHEYERGALDAHVLAAPAEGFAPLDVQLTAAVLGIQTGGLVFAWDWDHDGITDAAGTGLNVVTARYDNPGWYDIALCVSNNVGETADAVVSNGILAGVTTLYLATNGSSTFPYSSLPTAATSVHEAVAAAVAGSEIVAAPGTYLITQQVELVKSVCIRGLVPREAVFDGGAATRGFRLANTGATLAGLTVRNGQADDGGGVFIFSGGTVSNCLLEANTADDGGAIYLLDGGVLTHSAITSNRTDWGNGGGIYSDGGTIADCLIVHNEAYSLGLGGGLYAFDTRVVHCTIASNSSGSGAGGAYGGDCVNTILFGNQAPGTTNWNGGTYTNCCAVPLPPGPGNITNDPIFASASDWRLSPGSPCIDTGTNLADAAADLDGVPRPLDGDNNGASAPDLGCYEAVHPAADSDLDTMLDVWELEHRLNPTDATDAAADADGDQDDNRSEHTADTDPQDPADFFRIRRLARGASASVHFISSSNRVYVLRGAHALPGGEWMEVPGAGPRPGGGGADTMQDTNQPAAGPYYRLEVGRP